MRKSSYFFTFSMGVALCTSGLFAQAPKKQPPKKPPPSACQLAEYHQFDFWIGTWDVFTTGKDNQVAISIVESLYGSCVLRENWQPIAGAPGGSLNSFDRVSRIWRQTWADASGNWVEFTGGISGTAMILNGNWREMNGSGKDVLTRMTYSRGAEGFVRQLGEQSLDNGKTWTPSFDFTYRPRPKLP